MDQSGQQQHQQSVMGDANHVSQVASYPTAPMASSTAPSFSQPPVSFSPSQHQLAFQQAQHFHHQQQQQQQQQLQVFWANQIQEIEQTIDFKNHTLPLARIKKIMKADEDVRMISAEAPVVFAKACEMFILELTLRSWIHTEENKRRTLQKNDIAAAITRTDIFDFLVDIVPRDELKDESLGIPRPAPGDSMPYYYVPPQYPVAPLYNAAQQPRPPLTSYMPWQQQPQSQEQGQQSEEQDE